MCVREHHGNTMARYKFVAAVLMLLGLCFVDSSSAAVRKCAFDERDLKRCTGLSSYHCEEVRRDDHAVEGCAVPIICDRGTRTRLTQVGEFEVRPECVRCEEGTYKDTRMASNDTSATACVKHFVCDPDHGLLTYEQGTANRDSVCQCDLSKGYFLSAEEAGLNHTCLRHSCRCSWRECPANQQLTKSGRCESCPPGTGKKGTSVSQCQTVSNSSQIAPVGNATTTTTTKPAGGTEAVYAILWTAVGILMFLGGTEAVYVRWIPVGILVFLVIVIVICVVKKRYCKKSCSIRHIPVPWGKNRSQEYSPTSGNSDETTA